MTINTTAPHAFSSTDLCSALENPATWPFSPREVNAIQVIMQILNMLSILVALWVVVTYLLFKRDFPKSMPLFFGISALMLHIFLFIGSVAGSLTLDLSFHNTKA